MVRLNDLSFTQLHEFTTTQELAGKPLYIVNARELQINKDGELKPVVAFTLEYKEKDDSELGDGIERTVVKDLTLFANNYRRGFVEHFKTKQGQKIGPCVIEKKEFAKKKKGSKGSEIWMFRDLET